VSPAALLDIVRHLQLLDSRQLEELARSPLAQSTDPRALAREWVSKGWLTPYQVNQLMQGRGSELVIATCRILDRVGEGPLGKVLKVRHVPTGRVFAIKVFSQTQANPEVNSRFAQQATTVQQLQHPALVRTIHAPPGVDRLLLAMELLEGTDLTRQVQKSGPMPAPWACHLIRQVAQALEAAHARELIHGDIKPSNLFLCQATPGAAETLKLLDLAQAPLLVPACNAEYQAPEHAAGAPPSVHSDLYSLGACLFFVVTGRSPFTQSVENLLPVSRYVGGAPAGLDGLLRKFLARNPADRFASAAEALQALQPLAAAKPAPAVPQPAPAPTARQLLASAPAAAPTNIRVGMAPPSPRTAPGTPRKTGAHVALADRPPANRAKRALLIAAALILPLAALAGAITYGYYRQKDRSTVDEPDTPVVLGPMPTFPESTAPKTGPGPTTNPKIDPKIDPKVDPITDPKADPKGDPKVDPKIDPKIDPKTDPKVDPKVDPKIDPKVDPKVDPDPEPKLEAKLKQRPGQDKKLPAPTGPKQAEAEKEVRDAYDYASEKPADLVPLINRLIKDAAGTKDNPAARFVMLREARDLAIQAGRVDLAGEAVQKLDADYDVNPVDMLLSALEKIGAAAQPAKTQQTVVQIALGLSELAARHDDYPLALRLLAIGEASALKSENAALAKTVQSRLEEVAGLRKEYGVARAAAAALKKDADDPDANLSLGKFLALTKGDWKQGLPHLAKGADDALKALAQGDLAEPPTATARLKVADGWWDYAQDKGPMLKKQLLLRAKMYYVRAAPELAGLSKTKAERRTQEIQKLYPDEATGAVPAIIPLFPSDPGPAGAANLTGPFAGRVGAAKAKLVRDGGGNERSEAAVASGLEWLSRHQAADGSWNAAKHQMAGKCNCGQPGHDDPMYGTAIALLAFLGAGESNRPGNGGMYAKQVDRGLKWMLTKQNADGTLSGNGYIQGIAAIALCEAYGLTKDPQLKGPAQRAVNATINWQGPDGGFRYGPKQNGDTSVASWHIQALKTAQLAGLNLPNATLAGVNNFLDKVGTPDGSGYGYTGPQPTQRMTAAGLLCRQYQGWGPRKEGMVKGVETVRRVGPSPAVKDMYYYYYATQVMHNMGGEAWDQWNAGKDGRPGMRDLLIDSQDQGQNEKHQKGSWDPSGDAFGAQFGRMGHTCLCILTLEVYYRHPPLYQKKAEE
jgi:hypothetical protein